MSRTSFLSSPVGKNLVSAAVAGVVTYVRPARVPRWARRGLVATNTAGTGTSMLLGSGGKTGPTGSPAPLAGSLGGKAAPVGGAAGALATVAGGVALLTSTPGLKVDAKIEQVLLERGVRKPRLVMALGTVGLVFVVGMITERATKAAERKAAEIAESSESAESATNPALQRRN